VLLGHLLRKLEVVRRGIGHLALHLEVTQLLLLRNHAHVDVLLVRRRNLLLLMLQNLNLLCDVKLFHCASDVS
jgi:hypothetical protein